MSFITAINELSSTLILYTARTITMPVLIYVQVINGEFGTAAALVIPDLLCAVFDGGDRSDRGNL